MRLDSLTLTRFGHFDRLQLTLPAVPLAVVLGPNEAGKSTVRQALLDLLFGIHPQTPWNFRFGYEGMGVGADVTTSDGGSLRVVRRKGRKQPLSVLSGTEEAGPEAFAGLLEGVSEPLYRSVFGFALEDLAGGAAALASSGVDDLLAGGSLGGSADSILRLLAELETEASRLFRPAGSKQAIAKLVGELKGVDAGLKGALIGRRGYEENVQGRAAIELRLQGLESSKGPPAERLESIDRLLAHWDDLTLERALREQLSETDPAPLNLEAAARASEQLDDLARAQEGLAAQDDRLARLQDELEALALDDGLLERGGAIDGLAARAEQLTASRASLPARRPALDAAREALVAELRCVRPGAHLEALDDWAPSTAARESLAADAAEERSLRDELRSQTEARTRLQEELERLRQGGAEADDSPDVERLAAGLDDALRRNQRRADLRAELARIAEDIARRSDRLRPALPPDADPGRLPLPAGPQLTELAQEQAAARARADGLALRLEEALAAESEDRATLQELEQTTGLPSPEDLKGARRDRDARFEVLPADDAPAREAYLGAVAHADDLADRMWQGAEALARVQTARAALAARVAAVDSARRNELAGQEALEAWRRRWAGAWTDIGMSPAEPGTMRAWRDEVAAIQALLDERARLEAEADLLDGAAAAWAGEVGAALGESVEPDTAPAALRARWNVAQSARGRSEERGRRRQEAEREDAAAIDALGRTTDRLEQLQVAADRRAADWGLDPGQASDALERRVDELDRLSGRWRAHKTEERQLEAAQDELSAFDAEVAALPTGLGHGDRGPVERIQLLASRLAQERARQAERLATEKTAKKESATHARDISEVTRLSAALALPCEAVGAADADELRAKLPAVTRRLAQEREAEELTARLVRACGGQVRLAELARLAREKSRPEWELERAERRGELELLQSEREAALQEKERLRGEHERLGGDGAAVAAARREELRTELDEATDEYVVHRLAHSLLQRSVTAWTAANQPALLARAAEYLAQITNGRYRGIERSFGRDELAVVRHDGSEFPPLSLSTGTREQLFLALRMAFVERHVAAVRPLPVLADDVLVNFDPERARRALSAFTELGARTQVIYLTCHPHLAEMAAAMGAPVITLEEPT